MQREILNVGLNQITCVFSLLNEHLVMIALNCIHLRQVSTKSLLHHHYLLANK